VAPATSHALLTAAAGGRSEARATAPPRSSVN